MAQQLPAKVHSVMLHSVHTCRCLSAFCLDYERTTPSVRQPHYVTIMSDSVACITGAQCMRCQSHMRRQDGGTLSRSQPSRTASPGLARLLPRPCPPAAGTAAPRSTASPPLGIMPAPTLLVLPPLVLAPRPLSWPQQRLTPLVRLRLHALDAV